MTCDVSLLSIVLPNRQCPQHTICIIVCVAAVTVGRYPFLDSVPTDIVGYFARCPFTCLADVYKDMDVSDVCAGGAA